MIYQHPLAYLIGLEGLALLRAWAGDHDYDKEFVTARLAETRQLLDDETLTTHPGVLVERDATGTAYEQWAIGYDDPGNDLFDLDEPLIDLIVDTLPVGIAVDAACGTGRLTSRLARRRHRVVGVDSSLDMLFQARGRLPDAGLVVGELHRLPLPNDLADLVVIGLALTHVAFHYSAMTSSLGPQGPMDRRPSRPTRSVAGRTGPGLSLDSCPRQPAPPGTTPQ